LWCITTCTSTGRSGPLFQPIRCLVVSSQIIHPTKDAKRVIRGLAYQSGFFLGGGGGYQPSLTHFFLNLGWFTNCGAAVKAAPSFHSLLQHAFIFFLPAGGEGFLIGTGFSFKKASFRKHPSPSSPRLFSGTGVWLVPRIGIGPKRGRPPLLLLRRPSVPRFPARGFRPRRQLAHHHLDARGPLISAWGISGGCFGINHNLMD